MPVAIELPLFVVCLLSVVVGMVIGYLLEWLREHKHRRRASQKAREAARLNAEVERMRKQSGRAEDDVLALLGTLRRRMRVKICGLRSRAEAARGRGGGGRLHRARPLSALAAAPVALRRPLGRRSRCPPGVIRVALTVDASDAALEELIEAVPIDMLQLHGRETPERVADIRDALRAPGDEGGRRLRPRPTSRRSTATCRVADQLLIDARAAARRRPARRQRPGLRLAADPRRGAGGGRGCSRAA